jgi:hypothetical protein
LAYLLQFVAKNYEFATHTLFLLAASGHAGPVSLDVPVSPKMLSVFRGGNAALTNCLLPGSASARFVCLREARRCSARNGQAKYECGQFNNNHDGVPPF